MAIKNLLEVKEKISDRVRSTCTLCRSDREVGTFIVLSVYYSDHDYYCTVSVEDKTATDYGIECSHYSLFEDVRRATIQRGVARINKKDTANAIETAKEWFASIREAMICERFTPFEQ